MLFIENLTINRQIVAKFVYAVTVASIPWAKCEGICHFSSR